jgi:CubicO group peptidase (beta-lactamase class C family)
VNAAGKLELIQGAGAFGGGAALDKPPVFPSGAGGLVTTADDYLKFARMMLYKGEADGVRLLSPKAVQVMTTDYMTKEDHKRVNFGDVFDHEGFGYGLAIVADQATIGPSVGSFHWDGASGASWMADPREEMITIVLMQQYNHNVAAKAVRDIETVVCVGRELKNEEAVCRG